jgi:hypothetical protein
MSMTPFVVSPARQISHRVRSRLLTYPESPLINKQQGEPS